MDAVSLEALGQLPLDAGDQRAVAPSQLRKPVGDRPVGLRIDHPKSQLFQFLAHVVHAHAAGEGRVDLQRLLGRAPPRRLGHELERAHVVEAVGELDEEHADIGGDGQEKLPQIFRLRRLLGDEVELLDLGEALDQAADVLAESGIDLRPGGVGILDGIVEKRRCDGRVIELEVGENRRNFKRMREIRVAVGPLLTAMLLHGVDIGLVEQMLVRVRIVTRDPLHQLVLAHHRRGVPTPNRPAAAATGPY